MSNKFPLLLSIILFAGCAAPKFQGVSSHPVTKGTGGGHPLIVAGVPFWQDSTPAGKYMILGYAGDYWRGDAFDNFDFKHLAPVVKKNGGDAGVVIRGDRAEPGLVRESDEVGYNVLRLQVIKYLR